MKTLLAITTASLLALPLMSMDTAEAANLQSAAREIETILARDPKIHSYAWVRRFNAAPRDADFAEKVAREVYTVGEANVYHRPETLEVGRIEAAADPVGKAIKSLVRGAQPRGLPDEPRLREVFERVLRSRPGMIVIRGFEENSFAYAYYAGFIDPRTREALFVGVGYSE